MKYNNHIKNNKKHFDNVIIDVQLYYLINID